jgi:hypothetical protein
LNRENRRWLVALSCGLIAVSAILYAFHFLLFRDAHHIFLYLVGDIAFLPLEVLIVGLIIERLISIREKRALAHKLNMVIGAFFSEVGNSLLAELLPGMTAAPQIREALHLQASWKKEDFSRASHYARCLTCPVDLSEIDVPALREHMVSQRQFILRLLENPNLLEHDRFTDLLWAVHHLEEELEARTNLTELHPSDEAHLQIDVRRAFNALLSEWVIYVSHLKQDYPYLFSLVVRMHPFQEDPSIEVLN